VKPKLSIAILILAANCVLLCGCVGATRLPARSMGPAGAKIEPKEIDLSFLQVGTTGREEVTHQLAAIDTAYSNPRLFWGRWSESRWGYWWVVGWPCNGCMAGDANRKWHVRNLLVTFDENGVVTSKTMVGDDRIWPELHSELVRANPPSLDLSQPIRVSLTSGDPGAILLGTEFMEFERRADSGKPNVKVAVRDLIRFRHSAKVEKKTANAITCHALELSQKSTFGSKVKFCGEANQIGILFQYLQQVAPAAMNWQ